jgi:hypothetical protein
MSGVEKLHSRKHKNIKKDSLQLALALLTKSFRLNFTLNQSSQDAKQHTYIVYFGNTLLYTLVKSTKFSNIFVMLYVQKNENV